MGLTPRLRIRSDRSSFCDFSFGFRSSCECNYILPVEIEGFNYRYIIKMSSCVLWICKSILGFNVVITQVHVVIKPGLNLRANDFFNILARYSAYSILYTQYSLLTLYSLLCVH